MRILVGTAAVLLAAVAGSASAQMQKGAAGVVRAFGLVGTWADDCGRDRDTHQARIRMIFEVPGKGPPTRTTISSDGAHKTTVKADIVAASRLDTTALVIEARITGGDRDGGPLPAAALLGIDQSFEKNEPGVLYVKGKEPLRLERCPGG